MYRKTVDELQNDQREKLVIDIRSEEDYTKETYPGAKHIFWETFMDHIGEIPKDQPVYLFCYTGQRSDEIAEELSDKGYEIYSIEGGYRSYLRKKLADFMKEDDGTAERLADKAADAERSIIKKFKKTVWRPFTKAINAYEMIQDGDKIAVCISGGKDSMLMAKLFQELERHGKKNFEVVFLVMNPGYNEVNYQTILNNAKMLNIPITVFRTEIFDTVVDITDSPCYLCARMRRGYLYSKARELGCNKIAYAHHKDDVVETFLMSQVLEGRVHTFSPVTHLDGTELDLIRPLVYVTEAEVRGFMRRYQLPVVKNLCPVDGATKREAAKQMLAHMEEEFPKAKSRMFAAIQRDHIDGW